MVGQQNAVDGGACEVFGFWPQVRGGVERLDSPGLAAQTSLHDLHGLSTADSPAWAQARESEA